MKIYMIWLRMTFLSVTLEPSISLRLRYILDLSVSASFFILLQRSLREIASQHRTLSLHWSSTRFARVFLR